MKLPENVFFLTLIFFNTIGVFLYFIGCAVGQSATFSIRVWATPLSWFLFVFYTCIVTAIAYLTHTDRIDSFKLPLVAFLAVAFSTAISEMSTYFYAISVSPLINTFSTSGPALIVAGSIIITLTNVVWIIKIGSDQDAFSQQLTAEQTLEKRLFQESTQHPRQQAQQALPQQQRQTMHNPRPTPLTFTTTPTGMQQVNITASSQPHIHQVSSTSTPKAPIQQLSLPGSSTPQLTTDDILPLSPLFPTPQPLAQGVICKCVALYPYTADQTDAKEVSFQKGDVFEIVDNGGKWWQAKKEGSDDVKIVPSNYMKVMD